jgi:hypothetical protein
MTAFERDDFELFGDEIAGTGSFSALLTGYEHSQNVLLNTCGAYAARFAGVSRQELEDSTTQTLERYRDIVIHLTDAPTYPNENIRTVLDIFRTSLSTRAHYLNAATKSQEFSAPPLDVDELGNFAFGLELAAKECATPSKTIYFLSISFAKALLPTQRNSSVLSKPAILYPTIGQCFMILRPD